MEGIIFVVVLVAGATLAGIRSRRTSATPGVLMTLALVAGCAWYVFA